MAITQMYATVFVLAFLLAVLAHVKIVMLQSSMTNVVTVIGDRFKVVDSKVARMEAYNNKPDLLIKPDNIVPNTTMAEPAKADPERISETATVLQTFYGLNDTGRKQVFETVHTILHGQAFEVMYKACMDATRPAQRASDVQAVLSVLDSNEFASVRRAILNASVDHHAKPQKTASEASGAPTEVSNVPKPGPTAAAAVVGTGPAPNGKVQSGSAHLAAPILEPEAAATAEINLAEPATPVSRKRKARGSKASAADTNVSAPPL